MPRTAGDIPMPSDNRWPPAGKYLATCIGVRKWRSPNKHTPAVMLTWRTPDDQFNFEDAVYVTEKTVPRLNLVAQRVCGMPDETELPDDNLEAARFLALHIFDHAHGRQAIVTIDEHAEQYMDENTGQKKTRTVRRVAFAGYEAVEESTDDSFESPADPGGSTAPSPEPDEDDDIPF